MNATFVARRLAEVRDALAPKADAFGAVPGLSGRVAILPSAFNPPTIAHFELLRHGLEADHVASAGVLLTTRNVDKGISGASLEDRLGMLLAEQSTDPWFSVLATNQARIIDQERALAGRFPDVAFDFVVGYDTLVRLFDARYYTSMHDELRPFFGRSRVIALNRGPNNVAAVRAFVANQAPEFESQIIVRELSDYPASLSSTMARAAVLGESEAPVPSAVADYIRAHRLYRD